MGAITYVVWGNKLFALFLIFAGVGFDGLDGIFHRRSGRPSHAFGRVADSCADAITFCLAPGFALAVDDYPLQVWSPWHAVALAAGVAVAGVGLARLVYFTLSSYAHPYFLGASTPQNAMLVVLLVLLFEIPGFVADSPLVVLAVSLVFVPVMVLPLPYPKTRKGAPLRPVTGAMAAFLALSVVLVNFRPAQGSLPYDLAFSGGVVAFLLLLAFYAVAPILMRPRVREERRAAREEGTPETHDEGTE